MSVFDNPNGVKTAANSGRTIVNASPKCGATFDDVAQYDKVEQAHG